nr:O-antigen ligase family protein [Rhodococcus sp. BL-253-APC-6A1W]
MGVWSTDGRFPLALGVILGLAVVFGPRRLLETFSARKRWLMAGSVVLWLVIAHLSVYRWTNSAFGGTAAESSAAYRPAIYSFIPDIIKSNPLGVGFDDIPRGVWLVRGRSVIYDLGNTVDSELVLLALRFGVVGLVAFAAIWIIFIMCPRQIAPIGLMGSALMVGGLTTALSAWNTLGSFLFILLGISLGSIRRRGKQKDEIAERANVVQAGAL